MKFELSGNEVYYTNSLILLVKDMLCSQPRCQKVLNSIPLSYKIQVWSSSMKRGLNNVKKENNTGVRRSRETAPPLHRALDIVVL
jgi:hypothetical protein